MTDRKLWKTGASSCYKGIISDEIFEEYRQADIEYMELSSGKLDFFKDTLDYSRTAREIYQKAKSHGITITSIHLPFSPFVLLDPVTYDHELRDKTLEIQGELIRRAADSGIRTAVIHPSGEPYKQEERNARLENCKEFLLRLQGISEAAGMKLALENLPRTCLCNTSEEMLEVLDAVPGLQACFDTNHSLQQPNPTFIRALGDRIVTLHVSDYDFIDEKHIMPGEGKNPWNDILTALEEVGYNGIFMYEVPSRDQVTLRDIKENHRKLCL